MRSRKYFYLSICCFLYVLSGRAGESRFTFNRLDVNNGLSSNEICCVYKDRKGFMWFGTGAGLARFDGYEFRTFRHEVDNTLFSEDYIVKIIETADGNLWITHHDGKISIYNPLLNRFYALEEMNKGFEIHDVFQEYSGRLLYTAPYNELRSYDCLTGETVSYNIDRTEGAVCDVFQKNDTLYLIHYSGTIEIIDARRNICLHRDSYLKAQRINSPLHLFVDSSGEIWVYMNPEHSNGLFRLNNSTGQWSYYSASSALPLTSSLIRDIIEDDKGLIWIATDHGGINILDKERETITCLKNNPFDSKSISQNSVICLYKDEMGIIWCGTYKSGICYFHESIIKFESIFYPVVEADDAGINDSNCIYEDHLGNLWIGTNGNGLLCYNRSTGQYKRYMNNAGRNSLSSNIVICITGDRSGNLWIGTYMGGLNMFDGRTFTQYTAGKRDGISSNSVYCLHHDDNNNLWIGTLGGGLDCLDLNSRRWSHFKTSNESPLLSNNIYSISRGEKNELMIGTALGVNLLDMRTGTVRKFAGTEDGKSVFNDKAINFTFRDSRRLMWIGSNNGLSIYDSHHDKLYRLDKSADLPDNSIMSIMEDSLQVLWLGTKNGLLKITPLYDSVKSSYSFSCITHYEDEGIEGRIFNRNSVCHTLSGDFIFGGINGLTIFNPACIKYSNLPPKPVIPAIILHKTSDERNINTDNLSLSYDERGFTVIISAFNYLLPKKTKLSFMMEGFDRKWTTVDISSRHITYANLPAGKYRFMVKAESNGIASEETASLNITILPPAWMSAWAIFAYVAAVFLILYLMIKMFLNIQVRRFRKEQELTAASQLHEMDEMKLRFFTNVSHEFRTPLTLIMTPLEKLIKTETNSASQDMLKLIYDNAGQLLRLVNQLLDFRKIDVQKTQLLLSSGDIVLFVRNIVYSFKDISEQKNIRYSYTSAFPSFLMNFDTDKVFKIISNLLSNAFKFTPEGGEISVSLQMDTKENGNMIVIQVSDTGTGIASDQLELIFNRFYQVTPTEGNVAAAGTGIGLHMCREFARIHNGSVCVKSELGKGSVFILSLPVTLVDLQEVISSPNTEETVPDSLPGTEAGANNPVLLFVDDNTNFRKFMHRSLTDQYRVLTAANGSEAWEIIIRDLPDIIVSDIMMPMVDGLELCKLVKNDIRTSHIPIILLTAKSNDDNKLIGLEAGADDYVEKPFNMDILLLKIRHLVELKERMQKQLLQSIQMPGITVNSLDEQLIRKSVCFIEENMSNTELSVEWLGREMGMSRTNFYKKILSITGKTPLELIRTIRLKHAATLLEQSQMRIGEIALQAGFNDNKLFRKYFKEEFGRLPSELNKAKNCSNIKTIR